MPGRTATGFDAVAAMAARRLEARLARPVRAAGDWAITAPGGCDCDTCEVLTRFLQDPKRRVHEWPLKEQDRRHVHSSIDSAELPVSHVTRRQGRPYTPVLTKLEALFDRERTAREQDEADLRWLAATRPRTGGATAAAGQANRR